jgi:hypothetical protein
LAKASARNADAAVNREQRHRPQGGEILGRDLVDLVHDESRAMPLGQERDRLAREVARPCRRQIVVGQGSSVGGLDGRERHLAPQARPVPHRHVRRDGAQPWPQRPILPIVVPASPQDEKDLLRQILGVGRTRPPAPEHAVDEVELALERADAARHRGVSARGSRVIYLHRHRERTLLRTTSARRRVLSTKSGKCLDKCGARPGSPTMMRPFLLFAAFLTLTSTCASAARMPSASRPDDQARDAQIPPAGVEASADAASDVLVLGDGPRATSADVAVPPSPDARLPGSPDAQPAATRMKWWHEAKFGMFIHWGLYSALAGSWNGQRVRGGGEWIMTYAKIPVQDYAHLADTFAPTRFDAERWVQIAKDAGMKYIVITAKHHEGFAMYPSKVSPFNLTDATSWKRDPLRELAAAAKRQGIKFGVYYSHAMDWHHPGGSTPQRDLGPGPDGQHGRLPARHRRAAGARAADQLSRSRRPVVGHARGHDGRARGAARRTLRLQPQIITNNPAGSPLFRRLRRGRADHSGCRRPPRLRDLHDDERHLGLPRRRRQVEEHGDAGAQPGGDRRQRRKLSAERRPDRRR